MKKAFVVLVALLASACAYKHQPIYNVDKPMPATVASLPTDRVEAIIVEAGQAHNWKFQRVEPGHLMASQANEKQSAVVDVYFDRTSWRIVHRSSTGMGEEKDTIHSHYNVWIKNLEKDIDSRLTNAAFRS